VYWWCVIPAAVLLFSAENIKAGTLFLFHFSRHLRIIHRDRGDGGGGRRFIIYSSGMHFIHFFSSEMRARTMHSDGSGMHVYKKNNNNMIIIN
jgi:hypothetical protein